MIKELITSNRSIRRFDANFKIEKESLLALADLARLSPSAGNLQPLKYFLSWTEETNQKIFPCLRWARALKEWAGPAENERPGAYIVILGDKRLAKEFRHDTGIAAQSILLGATEQRLGGCMIGSCDRKTLRKALDLENDLEIQLVIALGKPAETVIIEPLGKDGNTNYYRDENGKHHVPKRSLDTIILQASE